jgi:hypothetical protein
MPMLKPCVLVSGGGHAHREVGGGARAAGGLAAHMIMPRNTVALVAHAVHVNRFMPFFTPIVLAGCRSPPSPSAGVAGFGVAGERPTVPCASMNSILTGSVSFFR